MSLIRRFGLLRAYLAINAAGLTAMGTLLIVAPHRLLSTFTTVVLFRWIPKDAWAVVFLLTAVLCMLAMLRDSRWSRASIVTLFGLQAGWSIGLTAPIFLYSRANVIAPVSWLMLLATTVLVFWISRQSSWQSGR